VKAKFVKISFDLYCAWEGNDPSYRVYVADELFSDRTWTWDRNTILNHTLQIEAVPGQYDVTIERLSKDCEFSTYNHRVEHGEVRWLDKNKFEII
jgi:hypothetical protein